VASDNFASILRNPGRLVWDPTDLSIAFPHGGKSLGFTRDGVLVQTIVGATPLVAEDFGGVEPFNYMFIGQLYTLSADLIQWDDDTLQVAFPGGLTVAGGTSGERVVQYPGTLDQASLLSSVSGKLLFSPEDLTSGKVVLFKKVVPFIADASEILFRRSEHASLKVVFRALRDIALAAAKQVVEVGDRRDITI